MYKSFKFDKKRRSFLVFINGFMGIVAVLFLLSPLSSKSNGSIKSIVGFGAVFIFIQTFQIFLKYRALLNSEFFIDEDKISHKTVKIEKSLDIKSLSSVEIAKTNITILNIKKVLRFSSGLDKIEVFLEDYGITVNLHPKGATHLRPNGAT